MRVFYLDTSAINRLYDSQISDILVTDIQNRAVVYPSIFNVAELASESNKKRRDGLLRLTKKISNRYRPLAKPSELLIRALKCVRVWEKNMDYSMSQDADGVASVLNNPALLDDQAYLEVLEWKRQEEKWFHDMHCNGRAEIQELINRQRPADRSALLSSFSKMIRFFLMDRRFVKSIFYKLAAGSGADVVIDDNLVERLINHSEHWRFFLASMAYGLYVRSIRPSYFSKKKNPGSIDTQQAIYLAVCDIFVTADIQQRRMLRLSLPFGHKKRKIWTFYEFEIFLRSLK